ncbi:MAG: WD40 repeat domain-containing protein [Cyanobacteria bacterium P01_D01_bin.1]
MIASTSGRSSTHSKEDPTWEAGSVELLTIDADSGGHTGPVRAVSFHPENRFFATSGSDRSVKTWDLAGQSRVRVIPQESEALSMQFSPDGRWLATGSLKGVVQIWNWRTGEAVHTLTGHTSLITSLTFTPDSRALISGSGDSTLKMWDVKTGENKASIRTGQFIQSVVLDPRNPQRIASAGLDKKIEIWNLQNQRLERTIDQAQTPIYAMDWRPNSQQVAFSPNSSISSEQTDAQRNTIVLFDSARNRQNASLRGHADYVSFLKFSPSGDTLLSGSWDESIKLWDVRTGNLTRSFIENEKRILSGDFSRNGKAFIVGSGDGSIKIYQSQK